MSNETLRQNFIGEITPIVQKYAEEYGYSQEVVPAIVAQACLESGYGTSNIASKANNFFGIKHGDKTYYNGMAYDSVSGQTYKTDEISIYPDSKYWRSYSSMDDSVKGYFEFLDQDNVKQYYSEKLRPCATAESYVDTIARGGYCGSSTSSEYANKIKGVMNENNIVEYCNNNSNASVSTTSLEIDEALNIDFGLLQENNLKLKEMATKLQNSYLSNNAEFLSNYITNLTNLINATTFLGGISNNSYQSTVSSLFKEDDLIMEYFKVTSSLLEKVTKEIENVINTSNGIIEMDNKLGEQAQNLVSQTSISGGGSSLGVGGFIPTPINNVLKEEDSVIDNPETTPITNDDDVQEDISSTVSTDNNVSSSVTDMGNKVDFSNDIDLEEVTNGVTDKVSNAYINNFSPSKKDNVSGNSSTIANNNNYTSTVSDKDNGVSPLGIALGAVALGGVGYAGKKTYDKIKKDKEDEEE